jgi:hypothetical protein
MILNRTLLGMAATAALLAGCGGGEEGGSVSDTSGARGSLVQSPPLRLVSLTAGQLQATLSASSSGAQLLQVTGAPTCGVDVHYIEYGTVGAANEKTNATGALMVPNGSSAACSGARPVVLYAHGTTTAKGYNIAAITDPANAGAGEGGLLAAMYAAQGFIVVAPNYAGYDKSTLSYHPYLVADQQSKDMIDALAAARKALPGLLAPAADNGKLFITGYSQGGHVAMATQRAMQAAGTPVTALVGQSGPYALSTLVDATFGGSPNLGGTVFTPLLTTSWQKAYGDIYGAPGDASNIYTATYATGIDTLMPTTLSFNELFSTNKLPQLALFDTAVADTLGLAVDSPFRTFYGSPSLIRTDYALSVLGDLGLHGCPTDVPAPDLAAIANPLVCAPANPFRKAARANDLRTYTPNVPVLLCGGQFDPTVFFASSRLTQGYFLANGAAAAGTLLVDVDSAATGLTDPFALAKGGFAQAKAAVGAAAAAATTGDATAKAIASATAIQQNYHGTLVPPFCNAVARGFFKNF